MPDQPTPAEQTLISVRDNLLRPMHDSLADRISTVTKLCRLAIWIGVINAVLLTALVAYSLMIKTPDRQTTTSTSDSGK